MERLRRYWIIVFTAVLLVGAFSVLARHADGQVEQRGSYQAVAIRNLESPGTFEIENQGPALAVNPHLVIQREEDGVWQDRAIDLLLAADCNRRDWQQCVTLEQGAKIRPSLWNGLSCGGQCAAGCRANVFLGPGKLRLVIQMCDRKHRIFGPSFIMPDYDHSALKKRK